MKEINRDAKDTERQTRKHETEEEREREMKKMEDKNW